MTLPAGAPRRSARLVPWVRAWRAGLVPYDDVITAVADDEEHLCRDLPGTWRDIPLAEALSQLSTLRPEQVRLVLPAPGDPRGLPGPGPFTSAALLAEEAVIAGTVGLVPQVQEHRSGSGDVWRTVTWQAYEFQVEPPPAADLNSPAEAELELSTALAAATDQLTTLDVARWRPELGQSLTALRRGDVEADLPAGYDPRARRLYARASLLLHVVALAGADPIGGAVNAHEAQQRAEALRPLAIACRHALVAASNAPLRL